MKKAAAQTTSVRPRVLVIDDEMAMCEIFRLELEGCVVITVNEGAAALKILNDPARDFEMVFCDINLASMTGVDVYNSVRSRTPGKERNFVFITGGVRSKKIQEFLDAAGSPTISKPINFEMVRQLVTSKLSTK